MYMGNGKFIHAPRTGKNIEVANINQSYWAGRFNGARRVNRSTAAQAADTSDDLNVAAPVRKVADSAPAVKCRKGKKCKAEAAAKKGGKAESKRPARAAPRRRAARRLPAARKAKR